MIYIFDHIFKTGGTSFNLSYLPAAFAPGERFVPSGFLRENQQDLQRLMLLPEEERQRLRIIAGHNTGCLRPHYPDAKFITLVRNPIERVVSAYLHAKFHPDAWDLIGREIHEKDIGLAHFVHNDLYAQRCAESVSVHDWQAKALLGRAMASSSLDDQTAVTSIQSRFYVVGYTEGLELFLFFLHVTEGFPLVLFNNRLVRPERQSFRPTPEDLAAIKSCNQLDSVAYRCARQQFDRRVSEIWTDDLAHLYREYLDALYSFRRKTGGDVNATSVHFRHGNCGMAKGMQ